MGQTLTQFFSSQMGVSLIVILVIIHLLVGGAAYLILLERKVSAWVQDRLGPNRVGPLGLLQPLADGLKLVLKEDYIPTRADRALFILAPGLAVMPALIAFAVIPWGGALRVGQETLQVIGANVNIGVVYLVAVASLGVYGVVLGGWSSNNKYSFLGGLRASAQMVSYEIPMGLALLCIILTAGSVRTDEIVAAQLQGGWWFLLQQPVAAVLFYTCLLAEANRAPFDLAEAEAELVGGWHTEYSSMKWTLYFLGEYAHLIVGGAFFSVLFLGGWSINPTGFGADMPAVGGLGVILLEAVILLGKVFGLVALTMVIRWTLPRFRFDQLMRLAWEGMIPTALVILLTTSLVVYMGWMRWMWAASLAVIVLVYLVRPLVPGQRSPNRRLPLIGSRFSPAEEA